MRNINTAKIKEVDVVFQISLSLYVTVLSPQYTFISIWEMDCLWGIILVSCTWLEDPGNGTIPWMGSWTTCMEKGQ